MSEILRTLFSGPAKAIVLGCLTLACGQSPTTGPGEIHWDRETCEQCQMVISDRRHAVQIREAGKRETHAFDDLGCALVWLDEQGLLGDHESNLEVWVRDPSGTEWVDGRVARYSQGFSTPMAYGFGTVEDGIPFDVVRERVREAERRRSPKRSK